MKQKRPLTNAEFQVMSILWNISGQKGCTSDILAHYEDPKPAYTTLATFLKILNSKGYVDFKKENSRLFFKPCVSKEEYAKVYLKPLKGVFFDNDIEKAISFILESEALTKEQAQAIADKAMSCVAEEAA